MKRRGVLKRAIILLICTVAVFCAVLLSSCGFTEYDRQKSAIKKVTPEEKYTFLTSNYLGDERLDTIVNNFIKRKGKKRNTTFVSGYLVGDRYYFVCRYYSTHKDEDYNGTEHYMNYLLGYIACPSGKVTAIKWLNNLPVEYSYSYPCHIYRLGGNLLFTVGNEFYRIDAEKTTETKLDISPENSIKFFSDDYVILLEEKGETKTYTALNGNFNTFSFEVFEDYYVKSCRGDYVFFSADYDSDIIKAYSLITGAEYAGDAQEFYESLYRPATVTVDGRVYAIKVSDGDASFTCGEQIVTVTSDDVSEGVTAMSEIEEIYGKKFYIRSATLQGNEIFLRLDNPRTYDMVMLPHIFGFGVEYTVSIFIKYDLKTGGMKYVGYAPDTALLLKAYKK